jgi:drug/metabolite transporter (DMT)-like permease
VIIGVVVSLLASVCFSTSNLLEKRAVDAMSDISVVSTRGMLAKLSRSPVWLIGFVVGVVAAGLMVLGYEFAPIAVVQTIFGAGLLLIVTASHVYLHESMDRREWIGLAVITVAVVLVSVTLTSAATPGVGGSLRSVMWASGATILVAFAAYGALERAHVGDASLRFGAASGLLYGVAALQTKSVAVLLHHDGIVHGVGRAFSTAYPYVFLVASLLGLIVFQRGLQRSRISVLVPLTNVVASVYVVVVGMVVFDEPLPSNAVLATLRLIGFALALVGNWLLAVGPLAPRVFARSDPSAVTETG